MNGCQESPMLDVAPLVNPTILTEKKCKKCQQIKMIEEYYLIRRTDRVWGTCKLCHNRRSRQWNADHPYKERKPRDKNKVSEQNRTYRVKNKESIREYQKKYYTENKSKIRKVQTEGYRKNKKKYLEQQKIYNANHREQRTVNQRKWALANPDKIRATAKKRDTRVRSTPKGKLNQRMASNIRGSIMDGCKSGRQWEGLVGFTVEQLKKHLEKRFLTGMGWGNMGEWHIDHKVPIAAFNFEKPEDFDFKRCWSLKNLQPMWAIENSSKGAKLSEPFQMGLLI